ncbi:hypothetical protein LDB30_06905 [Acidithiobacillus ferrooxidans]|nr:hypothetical protein LDB30_06905 [Acidithiobacillus ferrooxidans]
MHNEIDHLLFVLRRALWIGRCRRADVDRAFGTGKSPNRGTAILHAACTQWFHLLYKDGKKGVFPRVGVTYPPEASAQALMKLISERAGPETTGIFPEESVPFLLPPDKAASTINPNAMDVLFSSTIHQNPIRILYVGLRRGENARWRNVWPRAMEFSGLQWRLRAQDMDAEKQHYPIKAFSVPRIFDAQPLDTQRSTPKDFRPRNLVKTQRAMRVHLSESLTQDQVRAIENEWGIRDGIILLPDYSWFEFRKQFASEPVNSDIVWPVITRIDPLEER